MITDAYTSCHVLLTTFQDMAGSSHVFGTHRFADSDRCDFIEMFSKLRQMITALPADLLANVYTLRHCRAAHEVSY